MIISSVIDTSGVIDALREGLWGLAIEMWRFAFAFLAFLAVLALVKIGLRRLIRYVKNKLSRS